MKIGIDIDGVLTNLERFQLDYGSKFMFEHYNKEVKDGNAYETTEMFNIDSKIDDSFWDEYLPVYATKEPARKYASEVINRLHIDGNEIYIITARYLTDRDDEKGNNMRETVKKWLENNNIFYNNLIFSPEDKLEICEKNNIDLMIEDKPDNINKISRRIPVICFNAGYNRQCKGDNIIRCYSWYDIYAKIQKLIGAKK